METFSTFVKKRLDKAQKKEFPNLHHTLYSEVVYGSFHAKVKEATKYVYSGGGEIVTTEMKKLENDEERKKVLEQKDKNGMTPFHTAAFYRLDEVCQTLYQYGADLDATSNAGYTPLFIALGANQDIKLGTWLLDHGADPTVSAKLEEGGTWTIFHAASMINNEEIMRLLVKYGANPTTPYSDGTVELTYAKSDKKKDLIYELSRRYNRRVEKLKAFCSWCGKTQQSLKRCKSCYVVFYCSKECQVFDWKFAHSKGCKKPIICGERLAETMEKKGREEYYVIEPFSYLDDATKEIELSAWNSYKTTLRKTMGKHFVVALQIYDQFQTLIVYNQDYSIHTKVFHTCDDSEVLRNLLSECPKDQALYLWATPCDSDKGTFYVYPGRPAPKQPWSLPKIEIKPYESGFPHVI